jgi:ubiquinone/menaquinone biosynthesis C-methylase UbiE
MHAGLNQLAQHAIFDRQGRLYSVVGRRVAGRLYRGAAAEVASSGLPEGATVLDIGTGPAPVVRELTAVRPDLRLTGLDVGDAAEMPYPHGAFDLVISSLSMHHWEEPERVVADAYRVLRPGGSLWVFDMAVRRFERFTSGVRMAFGAGPAHDPRPYGPLGLPLIVRFSATRVA